MSSSFIHSKINLDVSLFKDFGHHFFSQFSLIYFPCTLNNASLCSKYEMKLNQIQDFTNYSNSIESDQIVLANEYFY